MDYHCCLVPKLCPTLCNPMDCSTLISSVLHCLHWVINATQPAHLLLPPSPPALNLSQHQFSNELAPLIRWPKSWSFSISPLREYSGLISFRIDSFDLFAVQGTLKSLFQHNLKVSILWCLPSLWSSFHIHSWLLEKPYLDYMDLCWQSNVSAFLIHCLVLSCVLCLVAQLCPTLCKPMDCSPPGSSVHGGSPGKNTEVGHHALL